MLSNLKVTVPKGGQVHYGSEPTSSRRLILGEIERLNATIKETAWKLQLLRKGAVSFAVYESLSEDAERQGRSRGTIEWDTVDRTCTYYEKFTHDKDKDVELQRRRIELELVLDDLQRTRDELLTTCMGR